MDTFGIFLDLIPLSSQISPRSLHLLKSMENDLREGDLESYITRDVQYHMLIAESSKNRVLVKVLETIRDILRQFIKKFFLAMPSSISDSMAYHKRVYEAIRDHDPTAARERMEEHIKSLIDRINESFNG